MHGLLPLKVDEKCYYGTARDSLLHAVGDHIGTTLWERVYGPGFCTFQGLKGWV